MRQRVSLSGKNHRGGFTLIELLVVITIVVILAALTVGAIYATANSDRIRGASRQMQSAMQGAASRAARFRKPIGIRLQLDQQDPTTVTSMIYVERIDDLQSGSIIFKKEDPTDTRFSRIADNGSSPRWQDLRDQGVLPDITRIKIIDDTSIKTFIVNTTQAGSTGTYPGELILISIVDYADLTVLTQDGMTAQSLPLEPDPITGLAKYKLELGNVPLANEDPIELPGGNSIDLFYSWIPTTWYEDDTITATVAPRGTDYVADLGGGDISVRYYGLNNPNRPVNMDIMFSPQGVVTGDAAAAGKIHLLLAEVGDTERNLAPEAHEGESMITSIFTNTGKVSAALVDKDSPPAYYEFAESGEVAGR